MANYRKKPQFRKIILVLCFIAITAIFHNKNTLASENSARNYRFEYIRNLINTNSIEKSSPIIFKIPLDIISQTKDLKDFKIIQGADKDIPFSLYTDNNSETFYIQTEITKDASTTILADIKTNLLNHTAVQIPNLNIQEQYINLIIETSEDQKHWIRRYEQNIKSDLIENNFIEYNKTKDRFIRIVTDGNLVNNSSRPLLIKFSPLYAVFTTSESKEGYRVAYKSDFAGQNFLQFVESLPENYTEARLGIQEKNPFYRNLKENENREGLNNIKFYTETLIVLTIALLTILIVLRVITK